MVGFLVSLTVIGIFASITEGLVDTSPLTRFDVTVAGRLEQSAAASALATFRVLSALGGRGAMTLFLVGGGLYYAIRRKGLELSGWCAAFIGGSLLDAALRVVVRRSELPFADVVLIDWGMGLVSGKALGVVVGYGMMAYLLSTLVRGALTRELHLDLRHRDDRRDHGESALPGPAVHQRRERGARGWTRVGGGVRDRNRDRPTAEVGRDRRCDLVACRWGHFVFAKHRRRGEVDLGFLEPALEQRSERLLIVTAEPA